MKKIFSSIVRIFYTSIFLVVSFTYAQEVDSLYKNDKIELPLLDHHKFVLNNHTRSPFIKTYFSNSLGFGQALDLQVPIFNLDGKDLYGLRGNLYFALLEFEYQYAVNNWLAVWIGFGLTSRLGDGVQTLLAQGINTTTDYEIGWMFKLLEAKKYILSCTVNLWNNSGTIINLYDFIQRIIDEGEVAEDNQLVMTRNFIQLGGGFRFAWAVSDLVGVNLLTEFAYGQPVDRRDKNDLFYNTAGSMDLDMDRIINIPIGFAAGFRINSFIAASDVTVKNKVGSIFFKTTYNAESDFLIGVDLVWRRIPINQIDQVLYGGSVVLNIDYYF